VWQCDATAVCGSVMLTSCGDRIKKGKMHHATLPGLIIAETVIVQQANSYYTPQMQLLQDPNRQKLLTSAQKNHRAKETK
jgi:hypothetical protein